MGWLNPSQFLFFALALALSSPDLRLQLLEPENHPYLFKCLYGVLMLLPQSGAFTTLRTRLNSVSSMGILNLMPKEKPKTQKLAQVDFESLLKHFVAVQQQHQEARRKALLSYRTSRAATSLSLSIQQQQQQPQQPQQPSSPVSAKNPAKDPTTRSTN